MATNAAPVSAVPMAPVRTQAPVVPFRKATIERVDILPSESVTLGAASQRIERTVEGAGLLYGIVLRIVATTAGNAAATAFFEDAPWSAFDTLTIRDVSGEIIGSIPGYDAYLTNLINGQYAGRFQDQSSSTYLFQQVTGAGGTGGSFTAMLRLPVAIDRRSLLGILGNQSRNQKYALRTDIASGSASAAGPIYTTAPTNPAAVVLEKYYENYSIPNSVGPNGVQQEPVPPTFGTLHFTTSTLADSSPLGGSTVNHYLRRIGNTIRWIALVFRSNGLRATAETNLVGANIRLKIGDDVIFNETYQYRRFLMFERFGFDMPQGVLVYDAMHDFDPKAGYELGDDYYHTQNIVNGQVIVQYPSGFGSTNNSLRIITDDLLYVGPGVGV